ncbi:S-adenosyl-L-methionine-dependent methyltransferase [Xylariaceae sp. AK1471]|nr:S-adenosyl-L-methionine-dependent methyltransferase [Xylariaceae sp. AK1471]
MHSKNDTTAQHDAIREVMGGLVVCPIDLGTPGMRILDSGTGDGYWLLDLVSRHPTLKDATLMGTDITDAKFPKNEDSATVSFHVQSITKPWPQEWKRGFDLVQQRLVLGACGSFPFAESIKNLTELVKPDGWIQLIEPDQTCGVGDGPAMRDFITLVSWVFENMGGHVRYAYDIKGWLQEAGMVDIEERSIPLFLGAGIPDQELARRTARSTADAMIPLLKYLEVKGGPPPLPQDALDSLVSRLYEELLEKGGLYPLRVIYGRVASEL